MKQTIKFIAIALLSASIAFAIALAFASTLEQFLAIALFGGMFLALIMGAFSERENTRYESIKHRSGIKYNHAAVFIGTACLFMGTPKECEDLCDDLWHYAQQAEVRALTGEEDLNVI